MPAKCCYFKFIALILGLAITISARAQPNAAHGLKNLIAETNAYYDTHPAEKIYLHFDKPYYAVGDTVWFKAYIVMAADNMPTFKSAKLHVELINDSSKLIQQITIPLVSGVGQGYIPLEKDIINNGTYTLRAYTSWSQNFGYDNFFTKRFYIGKPGNSSWLLTNSVNLKNLPDGTEIELSGRIKTMQGNLAVANQPLEAKVSGSGKTILKNRLTTSPNGEFKLSFRLQSEETGNGISVDISEAKNKRQHIIFPLNLDVPQSIDVQFLPEGGYLVAGLLNKVAFKAVGTDGLGKDVKGIIVNSKNETVTQFSSAKFGMGNFMLVPNATETYTAAISFPNGGTSRRTLPKVKQSGIVMRVENTVNPDSVYLYVSATPDLARNHYVFITQIRDSVCYAIGIELTNGFYNVRIPKNRLGRGINQLALLNANNQLLTQRLIFVDNPTGKLNIAVNANNTTLHPKDSVAINLHVSDNMGKSIRGNLSVSVTSDDFVKQAKYPDNIFSHMLLSANLKGYIENAAWYLKDNSKETVKALDNLLLTQGWVGYNWDNSNAKQNFIAETDNGVSGKVTGLFGKPSSGVKVVLMSARNGELILLDTVSDEQGRFAFRDLPLSDTAAYTVKLRTKRGGSSGSNLQFDDFEPAKLVSLPARQIMPWQVNSDSTMINYSVVSQQQAKKFERIKAGEIKGELLNEVVIKSKSPPKMIGSFFAAPKQVITEKELIKAKRVSLFDYLTNSGAGLYSGPFRLSASWVFSIKGNFLRDIIVDGRGVSQNFVYSGPNSFYDHLNNYLQATMVSDTKKIAIYTGYIAAINDVVAYLVITTRGGQGPLQKSPVGTFVYRPQPMQLPKEFYKPRYLPDIKDTEPDYRSTIHWEPNVFTDSDGRATISFYAADKPATYTVTVQGTDFNGQFGYKTTSITISPKAVLKQ